MTHISIRDLHDYYEPTDAGSKINTLDRLVGVAYRKMTWWRSEKGRNEGFTLRYIDLDKAIDFLQSYIVAHQHDKLYTIVRGMKSKRKLLTVLKKLKDK